MPNVDSLSIQIKSNTKQASTSLKQLSNSVNTLSKSLNSDVHRKVNNFATSIAKLGASGKSLNGVKNYVNAMNRLAKSTQNIDTKNITTLTSSVGNLGESLSKVNVGAVSRFTSSIARLANAGGKPGESASGMKALKTGVLDFARAMSRVTGISAETAQLVASIAQLSSAGDKAWRTASALDYLGTKTVGFITKLSVAPQVSEGTIRLVTALGQLANAGAKANSVFNTLAGGARRTTSGFTKLRGAVSKVSQSFRSCTTSALNPHRNSILALATSIGTLIGKYWLLILAVKKVGGAVGSSMDFVETLNYFDNSLDTLKTRANEDWREMGYENADEYYNSFRKRSEETLAKMSGFNLSKGGNLEMTDIQNLGIDPNQLMNYQSVFTQMSTSLGLAATNASKLGKVLPEIGADMASLYNREFTDVWDDLQSGITGMARTWDKYGTNIRVANMQQYATEHQLGVTVSKMSQSDKVLLRTIMLLDSQRSAWTDLATTINQPRNQLRMLQANFTNLARAIGSIFMPIVAAVLPYLNAVMIVLNRAANAVASFVAALTGWKNRDFTGSIAPDTGVSDLMDETDDYTDSAGKAAKATKEWQNQLMGFDEIEKLEDTSDSGNGGGSGGSSGAGGGGLQGAFDSIYDEYQKAWDKAFNSMDNDAQRMAAKIQSSLKKAWSNEDGSFIGSALANWLNKGIEEGIVIIQKKKEIFKKFAKVIATSINGFVDKLEWKDLGYLIGANIEADLEAIEDFFTTVNWKNLGSGLAKSLNGYIESGAFQQKFSTLASALRGAIELAFSAIKTFDFKGLGKAVGQGISDFMKRMSAVDSETGLSGWQELGQSITNLISGIATALSSALEQVDWDSVGFAIGDFLKSIDWDKIMFSVAKAIVKAIGAMIKTVSGSLVSAPLETLTTVALGGLVFTKLGRSVGKNIITSIGEGLLKGDFKASTLKEFASNMFTSLGSKLSSAGTAIKTFSTSAIKLIGEGLTKAGVFARTIGTSLVTFATNLFTALGSKLTAARSAISALGTKIVTCMGNAVTLAGKGLTAIKTALTGFASTLFGQVLICLGVAFAGWNFGKWLYEKNVFGAGDWIDKIVEKSGLGKIATKIADFFQFDLPDVSQKVFTWAQGIAGKLVLGFLNKIPTWLQKLLGIDDKVAELKAQIKTEVSNLDKSKSQLDEVSKNRTTKVEAKADVTSAKEKIDKLTSKTRSINVDVKSKYSMAKLSKGWQTELNSSTLVKKVKIESDGSKLLLKMNNDPKSSNYGYTWLQPAAIGGLFKNGKRYPITKYASGGIPNQGQMFIAREAGPELVGKMGNATAVMNNDQIVASVARGVQSAVEAGMRNTMARNNGSAQYLQADISIDGRKVMESVLTQARTVSLENNGTNVFMSL